jgi:hypothetical protein
MALDLVRDAEGHVLGVTALEMETGEMVIFHAKATLFATGGAGRIFHSSTNAFINTGDGLEWPRAPGFPSRTWSSGNSTRRGRRARACSSPRACAGRAATSSTRTASASWSATRRR